MVHSRIAILLILLSILLGPGLAQAQTVPTATPAPDPVAGLTIDALPSL